MLSWDRCCTRDCQVVGCAEEIAAIHKTHPSGHTHFAPGVCDRLNPYLSHHIVGQELALKQLINAVCDHLEDPAPSKPLVLSAHGPPGVGKSLSHFLLARALYNKRPQDVHACPGAQCPGYKVLLYAVQTNHHHSKSQVLYGMDFTADQRQQQHALLRSAIIAHLAAAPESLLVVEEYDKLDCESRGLFRQLLENPQVANISMARYRCTNTHPNVQPPHCSGLLCCWNPTPATHSSTSYSARRHGAMRCGDGSPFLLVYRPLPRSRQRTRHGRSRTWCLADGLKPAVSRVLTPPSCSTLWTFICHTFRWSVGT